MYIAIGQDQKGCILRSSEGAGAAGTESPGNEVKAAPRLSGEQHDGSRQTRLTENGSRNQAVPPRVAMLPGGNHRRIEKPENWENWENWGIYLKQE